MVQRLTAEYRMRATHKKVENVLHAARHNACAPGPAALVILQRLVSRTGGTISHQGAWSWLMIKDSSTDSSVNASTKTLVPVPYLKSIHSISNTVHESY